MFLKVKPQGSPKLRLPEAKLKEAILHSEFDLREKAVSYFSRSHSSDTSVMPLVIQAVEKFGKDDAYQLIGACRHIDQTADTIDWIIDELNQDQSDQYENYTFNLSNLLLKADLTLLLPRESDIFETKYFLPQLQSSLRERLHMLSWDEETCWQNLESFCEEAKNKKRNEAFKSYWQPPSCHNLQRKGSKQPENS
ncbi:MAG TPA: hypothetical protein DD473_19440 [Planctomycetaceae bacterium]|nr:hypothetical protein [Planctomycetaceae bacterium]